MCVRGALLPGCRVTNQPSEAIGPSTEEPLSAALGCLRNPRGRLLPSQGPADSRPAPLLARCLPPLAPSIPAESRRVRVCGSSRVVVRVGSTLCHQAPGPVHLTQPGPLWLLGTGDSRRRPELGNLAREGHVMLATASRGQKSARPAASRAAGEPLARGSPQKALPRHVSGAPPGLPSALGPL